jgi:hypothetical protein
MSNASNASNINDINKGIDFCIINSSDYDISMVVYKILNGKYRYLQNNIWEYYNDKRKIWVIDAKNDNLKYDVKTIVCTHFTERSIFWNTDDAKLLHKDNEMISTKLLLIASKLKEDKYICTIIKESRQFFIENESN